MNYYLNKIVNGNSDEDKSQIVKKEVTLAQAFNLYTERKKLNGKRAEPLVKQRISKPADVGEKRTFCKAVTKHEPFNLS